MSDRHFTQLKAEAKLAAAQAEAAKAAAEVERAKADAERVRGETDRARMAEERQTRIAAEESARKTRESEAKIAADKRRIENEHLAGAVVGGMAGGKIAAHFGKNAAEARMAKLAPQVKALAKEAKGVLQGTGVKNHRLLKGIAGTVPHARGSLSLGTAAVLLGDAALGFYQSKKMREQGDEDAARNLETFARGSAIAGAATPLLRWDAERSSSKLLDLKSQAILKATKLAAEGEPGPEPKLKRARSPKPVVTKATAAEQKALAAPEKAPVLESASKAALPAPEKVTPPLGPAKAATPTIEEARAAAKQAFAEHPNPAALRAKMGPWYKYRKDALLGAMRDAKIKIPGYGLKYAALLTAGAAAASALMGAGESEAKSFSGRLADAGAAAKEGALAALWDPDKSITRNLAEDAAGFLMPVASTAYGLGQTFLEATKNKEGAFDEPYQRLQRQLAQRRAGERVTVDGYATPRAPGAAKIEERVPAYHRPNPAHEAVTGYWATRHNKQVWNKFSPEVLAARANLRGGA